jgi:hypothetical protein
VIRTLGVDRNLKDLLSRLDEEKSFLLLDRTGQGFSRKHFFEVMRSVEGELREE